MAKMKIFELKNEINNITKGSLESKDILDFVEKSFGVKKTHSSNLEDNEVAYIKNYYVQASKTSQSVKTAQTTPTASHQNHQAKPVATAVHTPAARPEGNTLSNQSVNHQKTAGQNQTRQSFSGEHAVQGTRNSTGQNTVRTGQNSAVQSSVVQSSAVQSSALQNISAGQNSSVQNIQKPASTIQNAEKQPGHNNGQKAYDQAHKGITGQKPAGGQGIMKQGQQGYQGQQGRPSGEANLSSEEKTSNNGQGYQSSHNTGRSTGEQEQNNTAYRSGNRPSYEGRTSSDGNQEQRSQNRPSYEGRSTEEGRSYNDGQKPQYRSSGEGYQGNRPSGQGYQGNRPSGEGYQGNRPSGQGYQGNRPSGEGYQGNRGQGGVRSGAPGGQNRGGYGQSGYSRPSNGQRPGGGYNSRGFEDMNKDDDDKPSYGNRSAQGRKTTGRPGERKTFDQQILDQKVAEKNDNSNKRNRDRINKEKNYKEKNLIERDDDKAAIKVKVAPKKGQFIQPKPIQIIEEEIKVIQLPEVLTIKELADKMKKPSAALIKKLFLAGKIVTLNQEITYEEAEEIALEYEIIAEKEVKVNVIEELLKEEEEDPDTMKKRPPVVCVMGHVDHGKTSLLDAIRETNVTSREAGGITQHIGAYVVEVNGEKITFLDTPGHEAFTSMRKRGANSTDIAILVVAADDGVMPQTVEAINHAKAAGVQIIVAINKIDKPSANIERVKQELTEYELVAEDWGGDTIFVPVSAHTKEGIDQLLEMILLTAEMVELKANPNRNARGIVIEAELDKGRGPVATILVQKGTLYVGDNIAVGSAFGKVRAMMDDKGRRVKEATPSTPVEILGLNEVPDAGETFLATDSEKEARNIAETYLAQSKEKLIADTKAKLSLDGLFSQIQAGNIKELNLIIKADVQGSVEAMKQSLMKLSNAEVAVRIIHSGVGSINESDVILASTSNGIIIGFNVRPDNAAKETAERENVDVKLYKVIYDAINDIEAAMKGMLDPIFEERIIGHAEIRMTFKASGVGTIAGSYVLDGKIVRGCKARVFRDNSMIYEGSLASLKRFQDDVKEVATGYECGLVFEKFNDVKEGDKVEVYIMAEVPR